MASAKKIVAAGALYGGGWLLTGGALGGVTDVLINHDMPKDIQGLQHAIEQDENYIVDADSKLLTVQEDLGEACLRLITPYTPGKQLDYVEESEVVTDIVTNPNHPCGDEPTAVRSKVSNLRSVTTSLYKGKSALSTHTTMLKAKEKIRDKDGDFNGLIFGLALCGIFGTAWGATAGAHNRRSIFNETFL